MRRLEYGVRSGARGFASQARLREVSGPPSVPTTWDRPKGLDEGRMNGGQSLRDQGGRKAPHPAPEVRCRSQKSPR
jgi:hypothetical protein